MHKEYIVAKQDKGTFKTVKRGFESTRQARAYIRGAAKDGDTEPMTILSVNQTVQPQVVSRHKQNQFCLAYSKRIRLHKVK